MNDPFREALLRTVTKTAAPAPKPQPRPQHKEPVSEGENNDIDSLAPVPLGFNHGKYYYLSREEGQVHEIPTASHGANALIAMARLSYWQQRFKGPKGPDWPAAIDYMMASCRKIGVFNHDILRGRGVSYDKGRSVLHLGNRLIVDGIPHASLSLIDSEYIYEKAAPLKITLGEPLTTKETYRILDICNMFSWATPDMGLLLAGWIVTAPVCGALPWRTHVWLTGQTGAGKTYVMSRFIRPLLGPLCLPVQSKTTEAGIRQKLRIDARPIMFDEPETQNDRDRDRIQQVLDLARQASSDDGFDILKGTVTGKEISYRIRSSFIFSSINFGAIQAADENRIVPLTLIPMEDRAGSADQFDLIKKMIAETVTEEFAGRLLCRTLHMLPQIRQSIGIFSRLLSTTMSSRQADTIGCLVAGVYSLISDDPLTMDAAKKFVADRTWIKMTANRTTTDSDHDKAMAHLMEQIIRQSPGTEWSVAEAIKIVKGQPDHGAANVLARNGIRVRGGNLLIGRSHSIIDKFFATTPWARVWDKTILQYPGASVAQTTVDFAGTKKRAVMIPLDRVISDEESLVPTWSAPDAAS